MLIERKWLESDLGVRVNFFSLREKKGSRSISDAAENQEKNVNSGAFAMIKGKEIRIHYHQSRSQTINLFNRRKDFEAFH